MFYIIKYLLEYRTTFITFDGYILKNGKSITKTLRPKKNNISEIE